MKRNNTWTLLALLAVTFILRLWHINHGLPFLYNVDESFIVPRALRFGSGDFNPHIFMWPHLFFYLLFGLYGGFFVIGRIGGVFQGLEEFKYFYFNEPSAFYVIGRTAAAVASLASVVMLYQLGKRYHSKELGLAAAGFWSFSHFHFIYSRLALPESTMTLLVIAVAYNAYRIYEEGKTKNYFLAGIWGGLAVSTKYNAFLIFVTVTLAHFFFVQREFGWRMLHRHSGRLLLVAVISLFAFLAGTPFAILDYWTFLKDISFTTLAAAHQDLQTGFGAAALEYLRIFFFPEGWLRDLDLIGIFVVAGVIRALVRGQAQDILLLIFPILHFLFFTAKTGSSPTPHYFIPMLPFLMLFAAGLCVEVVEWVSGKIFSKTPVVLRGAKVGTAFLFCLPFVLSIIDGHLRNQADTANLARMWVEANLPAGAVILYTDYHHLNLKRNVQSLEEHYGTLQEVPKEKIAAIEKYQGPTYYISELYAGWNDEARESVQKMNYLPQGVIPIQYEKFSLRFWLERKFQYAIVFRNFANQYLVGKESERFPAFRKFYRELFDHATLIMEFKPAPPQITGYHIQIFALNSQSGSTETKQIYDKNHFPTADRNDAIDEKQKLNK